MEWMCLPRMDSPSVFGSILDRDAGSFRLGPADVEVPAARRYLPGTMVLETSWGTRGGWIIVRDVLLIGPWHHEDERSTTHRRSPTDYDADHVLLRLVRCVNGEVQLNLDCEPVFDYGRKSAEWEYTGPGYHEAVGHRRGQDLQLTLTSDMNLGVEGPRATGRTMMKEGDTLFAALSWSEHRPPQSYDEAYERLVWTAHHWQHWLDHGEFPDHPWRTFLQRSALTLKGLSYAPTGAFMAAATTSLPETPGGERNWDYRYTLDPRLHLRPVGHVHAGLRLGGQRLLLLHRRRGGGGGGPAPDHVRDRRRVRARRGDARPPQRLRGRPAGAGRQRRLQPGAARRLGRGARLGLPAHQVARPPARADLADPGQAGRGRARALARARPRHLGGARRAQALHLVEDDVLGGAGSRRPAGRDPRGRRRRPRSGRRSRTRSRRTSARTRSTSAASSASTTTPTSSTRRCC